MSVSILKFVQSMYQSNFIIVFHVEQFLYFVLWDFIYLIHIFLSTVHAIMSRLLNSISFDLLLSNKMEFQYETGLQD